MGFPLSVCVGLRVAVLLFTIVPAHAPAAQQDVGQWRQVLVQRKADLLKQIADYQDRRKQSQSTLSQATVVRDSAKAAGNAQDENYANQAISVARDATAAADRNIADDRERLEAVERALAWPESQQPVSFALLTRGTISVHTLAGEHPFDSSRPLLPGTHLRLGKDAFLELLLQDGSQVQVGPGSDLLYDSDDQGFFYRLFQGRMRKVNAILGVLGSNEPRFRGLTAVAAVRGTDFTLEIAGGQDTYSVFEGEIEVRPNGGRRAVRLKAGQKLTVPKSGVVGEPQSLNPGSADRWWDRVPERNSIPGVS
jgi:FecR protein